MSQTLFEKQASWRLQTKVTNGNLALVTISNLFNKAPVAVVSRVSVSRASVSRPSVSRTDKAADRHSLVFFAVALKP
ncbi:hypothetical protein [Shewanella algae]|uniref:hypothetical protein n=1 Tax=Shewanella algae TaxID=38313 RepID=UPI00164229F6|nr:hypothetical protein [Shewanella algae]QNH97599.1 hypothetical protein HU689_02645 [Shewanella algae]